MLLAANSTALIAPSSSLIQAYQNGSLGVSLSIAGFLVAYLAGVVYMLADIGVIDADTRIAGASSGALLTMAHCSGLSAQELMGVVNTFSADCRRKSNCQGRLGEVLQQRLRSVVPPGAYRRCTRRAAFSISIGRFHPRPQNLIVDHFSSDDDLREAAVASSWIPSWSSGAKPFTSFRGQSAFDGVFSNGQPCPKDVGYCLKISSRNPPWSAEPWRLLDAIGRATSAGHFKPMRLAPTLPTAGRPPSGAAAGAKALQQAAALGVDIAPGIFSPQPLPQQEWDDLLILPADTALNQQLYELGRRDARVWAQLTGLEAAAAARRGGKDSKAGTNVVVERGSAMQP